MNIEETVRFLHFVHDAGIKCVPCLVGQTGTGKTDGVGQFSNDINAVLITLYFSQLEPVDFLGMKKEINGKTVDCRPDWLPDENDEREFVLFLDEANRAQEDMRQAMIQLLTQHRIHTFKLPKKTMIIMAINPVSADYETYQWDKAVINRIAFVPFMPSSQESLNYLKTKTGGSDILYWAEANQELMSNNDGFNTGVNKDGKKTNGLTNVDLSMDSEKLLTPRILELAADMWNKAKEQSTAFGELCLSTILSSDNLFKFMKYVEELNTVSANDIVRGLTTDSKIMDVYKKYLDDGRVHILCALVDRVCKLIKDMDFSEAKNKENSVIINNVGTFMKKLPNDVMLLMSEKLMDGFIVRLGEQETRKRIVPKENTKVNENAIIRNDMFRNIIRETQLKLKTLL